MSRGDQRIPTQSQRELFPLQKFRV